MNQNHFPSILLILLTLNIFFHTVEAESADPEGKNDSIPQRLTDFKTCALTTLKRTPQLQKTKIELEIRHLDEEDSRWSYLPTLVVSSSYFVSENEANLSFHTAHYRPWEPYYSLQAQKLITEIATLKHIQAASQALHELAETLLQLAALTQIDLEYRQIAELSRKKLLYVENLEKTGSKTPLELEIEKQTLHFINAEHLRNSARRETLLKGLSIAMDLPGPEIFDINYPLAIEQIIGSSESAAVANIPPPSESIDQQITKKIQLLQEKKILLARAQYLPDFSIGVRSPDVIDTSSDTEEDYFFYVGMSLTLWDGHKRARDIARQKIILRQMQHEEKAVESNNSLEWLNATEQFALAKADYDMSQSAANIKKLQLKRSESEYSTGNSKLPDLINQQIDMHRERMELARKELALNKAGLRLRHLSGQLLKDTVNISFADTPHE